MIRLAPLALTLVALSGVARAAPPALVHVDAPPAEALVAPTPLVTLLGAGEAEADTRTRATLTIAGRAIELALAEADAAFLVATSNGKRLWAIDEPPAAGGSDARVDGRPDRRVAFISQSRIGTWLLDVRTGKRVAGYGAVVVAPDATWALALPYANPFALCVERDRPARVRLDAALAPRPVPTAKLARAALCTNPAHDDVGDTTLVGAISADGARYAVASRVGGAARVEVFASQGDRMVAALTKGVPPFESVAFSRSGDFLVLGRTTDDGVATAAWYRIPR